MHPIATRFKRPNMDNLSLRRVKSPKNIPDFSPKTSFTVFYPKRSEEKKSTESPTKFSPEQSPRTKITKLINKEPVVVPEILKLRMSAPKVEIRENEVSPRDEQRQSSFFRRIFCLSPKKQSPRESTSQRTVRVVYEEKTVGQKSQKDLLQLPSNPMSKSSSQLSLKLQPVKLTDDYIQAKMDTMMISRPSAREKVTKSQSPVSKQEKQKTQGIDSQLIIQKLNSQTDLSQLLEESLKSQKSGQKQEASHKSLHTYEKQEFVKQEHLLQLPSASPKKHRKSNTISSKSKKSLNQGEEGSSPENFNISQSSDKISNSQKRIQDKQVIEEMVQDSLKTNILLQQKLRNQSYTTRNLNSVVDSKVEDFNDYGQSIKLEIPEPSFSKDMFLKSRSKLEAFVSGPSKLLDPYSQKQHVNQYRTLNSTHQSKASLTTTNAEKQKIKKILEIQKQNHNLSMIKSNIYGQDEPLFHRVNPMKQRSKSFIKQDVIQSGRTLNYHKKLLPLIKYQQQHLNLSTIDDQLLEQALDKYLSDISPSLITSQIDQISNYSFRNPIPQDDKTQPSDKEPTNDYQLPHQHHQDMTLKTLEQDLKKVIDQQQTTEEASTVLMSFMGIMMRHPIFKKMAKKSVKTILQDCCTLTVLRKNQVLYKEEEELKEAYIVAYGSLVIWSKKNGQLGKVTTGFTAGEESICDQNYVCRLDSCYAEQDSCVFTLDRELYSKVKQEGIKDHILAKDIAYLDSVLQRNFIMKKGWRSGGMSKLIQGKKIRDLLNQSHIVDSYNNSMLL